MLKIILLIISEVIANFLISKTNSVFFSIFANSVFKKILITVFIFSICYSLIYSFAINTKIKSIIIKLMKLFFKYDFIKSIFYILK